MIEPQGKYNYWWGEKLNIYNYGLLWIFFLERVLVGLLIYYILII